MQETLAVLVVDDDERICRLLKNFLEREGYSVTTAQNGEIMRKQIDQHDFDLIILDLVLPDEDGFSLARHIRSRSSTPIIMLTGKNDVIDKIVGLELGADDYITKPFDERELLARVRSVTRRTTEVAAQPEAKREYAKAQFDGLELDIVAHTLTSREGTEIQLTSHEFQLLITFIESPNRVLDRDYVLDKTAGRDYSPFDRSVDVLVGKLRRRIEIDPAKPKLIRTIRGAGYRFSTLVTYA